MGKMNASLPLMEPSQLPPQRIPEPLEPGQRGGEGFVRFYGRFKRLR